MVKILGQHQASIATREQLYTPPNWDVNLMDGRYIAAKIDKEKIIFLGRNEGFDIQFAFCKELAYLMGASYNYQDLVWYHSKSMDKLYKEPKPKIRNKTLFVQCLIGISIAIVRAIKWESIHTLE